MSMQIKCPHCGKSLSVAPHHIGKQIKCGECSQTLQIKAKKPLPVPRQIVQEEILLASRVAESLMASHAEEPSQAQPRQTGYGWLIGLIVSAWLFAIVPFLLPLTGIFSAPEPKASSPRLPTLIPPDTFCEVRGNTIAFLLPSELTGMVGRLNRGAGVYVKHDDGSGWVELKGYGAPVYVSSRWVRWPDEHEDAEYVDIGKGKSIYIEKKYLRPSTWEQTWVARPSWDYTQAADR